MGHLTFLKVDEKKCEVRTGTALLGTVEDNGTPPFFFRIAQAHNAERILRVEDLVELTKFIENR
jgi:hypothetical protein